ncbi:phosphatidylinositol phosphate synthase [Nonomuraea lactucae]|uniref:phosphatidylinositol phosphate synthase n=1 Tax=Nonomuraea lactucae TaxID=2249762 RepID=UPI000DE4C15C|nr:CDP-alcohol phosphatidyltransferase family protein [Nonomuraea lactucae]
MAYDRTAMLKLLRPAMTRILTPLGRALVRHGIGPNAVTAIGTLGTVVSALLFFPLGLLAAGALVITVFVLFDLLDGVVARLGGKGGSTWGAFLDSTLDRVADAAIFGGLILYFISRDDVLMAAVTLFCLVAGALVSYAKARAEGLGLTCDVGLAERPERLVVALVAAFLAGLGVPYVLPAGMWLLAAASAVTVVQRVIHVHRQTRER